MEWYRAATTAVPDGVIISPDVGHVFGVNSFLDFYVNGELQWGVELLREGQGLRKHTLRFEKDGQYANIPLKAWAVVDFRHISKKVLDPAANIWYAMYNEDFNLITVRCQGKSDVALELRGDQTWPHDNEGISVLGLSSDAFFSLWWEPLNAIRV